MTGWDLPAPHVLGLDVRPEDIDAYSHVNNAVYLRWLDEAAWSHSTALGVPPADCIALRRGMVVHRIELDYLRAALAGDRVAIATWIVDWDRRLRCRRRFQVVRGAGETLLRGHIDYVCTNLDTGRAARMPPEFVAAYGGAVREPAPPV
jgi:acyl-CoA thioester hydrolase